MKDNVYREAAENTLAWLIKAQDVGKDNGFASHYHRKEGWYSSYPEVSGYIIPTLIEYGETKGRADLVERAIKAADWLLSIQMDCGAFQGRLIDDQPATAVVFNTGMVLFGLVASYKKTGNQNYMHACRKAADWLIKNIDQDGAWRRFLTLNGTGETHIYHTRVSWALLEVFNLIQDKRYFEAAMQNITWARKHQRHTGWFDLNDLFESDNNQPLIHFMVYTIRGILESALFLKLPSVTEVAHRAAKGFLLAQHRDGTIYARYNHNWEPTVKWKCPVGIAQISIVYMTLYSITKQKDWLEAADENLQYLLKLQGSCSNGINGAIPGSDPLDGPYMTNCYLSWATKFFLEALLLREKITQKVFLQTCPVAYKK